MGEERTTLRPNPQTGYINRPKVSWIKVRILSGSTHHAYEAVS